MVLSVLAALHCCADAQADTMTKYVWQSADGDPGDLAGSIVVDSSSNPAGNISDIVAMTLSDDQLGVWAVTPDQLFAGGDASISWTASSITAMNLSLREFNPRHQEGLPAVATIQPNAFGLFCIVEGPYPFDFDGAWVRDASFDIPDEFPTLPILLLTTLTLVMRGHCKGEPVTLHKVAGAVK